MDLELKLIKLECAVLNAEIGRAVEAKDYEKVLELNENLLRLANMDEDYFEYLKETHIYNLDITEEQFLSGDY